MFYKEAMPAQAKAKVPSDIHRKATLAGELPNLNPLMRST